MQVDNDRLKQFEELFRSDFLDNLRTGSDLLVLANRFAKVEKAFLERHQASLVSKRLAILGTYSTQHLTKVLRLSLYHGGIAPEIYEGGYNSIDFETLDESSGLWAFHPELLVLFLDSEMIREFPPLFASPDVVTAWVESWARKFQGWWEAARRAGVKQVFHLLIPVPLFRPLGSLEANYLFSPTNLIRLLNLEVVKRRPDWVTLIDADQLSSVVGKERWVDERNHFLSKQGVAMDQMGFLARNVARVMASTVGKDRKCLVLDLDNTLWGGVIGDDGVEGINVDPNHAVGEAFLAFQRYVKRLKERGVILAVCSKNTDEIARTPFVQHASMVLRLEDFACFVASWDSKAENMRLIARKLNIGLNSLVFFDDNPAERELIRREVPEVAVVNVPEDPALYVRALDQGGFFDWLQLSKEDLGRSDSYVADIRREELLHQTSDYEGYLRSLEMRASFSAVDGSILTRFVQLINKTNQFNLRTIRYTPGAVEGFRQEEGKRLIAVDFADKFSHYGTVACLILEHRGKCLFIDTWVMSCRVFKRGLEDATFNEILRVARELGCRRILGAYFPTEKNGVVRDLYPNLGFRLMGSGGAEGSPLGTVYELPLDGAADKSHCIALDTGSPATG